MELWKIKSFLFSIRGALFRFHGDFRCFFGHSNHGNQRFWIVMFQSWLIFPPKNNCPPWFCGCLRIAKHGKPWSLEYTIYIYIIPYPPKLIYTPRKLTCRPWKVTLKVPKVRQVRRSSSSPIHFLGAEVSLNFMGFQGCNSWTWRNLSVAGLFGHQK